MRVASAAGMLVMLVAFPAAANELMRANFLNAHYCAGAAEAYGAALGGSEAKEADALAGRLRSSAAQLGRTHNLSGGEKGAEDHGRRAMSALLPAGGAWKRGGDVPIEAVRQYQQCVSLVRR